MIVHLAEQTSDHENGAFERAVRAAADSGITKPTISESSSTNQESSKTRLSNKKAPDSPDLLSMYRRMVLCRTLDERIWMLNRQGKAATVSYTHLTLPTKA